MIVHCPWIVPDGGKLGMSPLEHFQAFWKAGISAQEYADVNRGGGLPPAVLRNTQKTITREQAEAAQASAVRSFASGKPFVTGSDWDLSMNTIPPNQAQFLNTLQLTANQTAAIFGIDPREIGGSATESLTYATDESRSLNRANNLRPYMVRFEQMTARILPNRQYVRLNVDATIRTDIKTRTEVIGAKIADGRMNVDEARALEDEMPLPNGQGATYNVATQTTRSDSAAKLVQQMYLGVGKVITLREARDLINDGSGSELDLDVDAGQIHADLPPLPSPDEPPAPTTKGDPS
jgi:HK97 family phage portal protein